MNLDFHYVFVIFDNRYYVINDIADHDRTVDPCCDNVVGLVFGDLWPAIIFILCFVYFDHNGGSASTRVSEMTKIVNKDNKLAWFYQTTKYKAGTLPLNIYQTAVHRGGRLEFAPVERVEQPEFSKEEGREGAPTSRDPGDDQLSEYDDDSSDNDSDDFAVEEDGAIFVICRTRNSVSFLHRAEREVDG